MVATRWRLMKPMKIFALLAMALLPACGTGDGQPAPVPPAAPVNGPYDHMLFERSGGGNLVFSCRPSSAGDKFAVHVTRLQFAAADTHVQIAVPPGKAALLTALQDALAGKVPVSGEHTEPGGLTGTWVKVSLVSSRSAGDTAGSSASDEVTNPTLLSQLLGIESLVRAELAGGAGTGRQGKDD